MTRVFCQRKLFLIIVIFKNYLNILLDIKSVSETSSTARRNPSIDDGLTNLLHSKNVVYLVLLHN